MKNILFLLSIGALSLALFTHCSKETEKLNQVPISQQDEVQAQLIEDHFIVGLVPSFAQGLLQEGMDYELADQLMKAEILATLSAAGLADVEVGLVFHEALLGFSAKLENQELLILESLPIIDFIEQDQIFDLVGKKDPKTSTGNQLKAQQTPWGINATGRANGSGKRVFVIDTGADLDHPDLNVNQDLSTSYVGGNGGGLLGFLFGGSGDTGSPEDGHGHGTHVAGTIAAKDNSVGVIGVAYGAEVVAIKVLDNNGSGATSGVIKGVDYVAANGVPGNVANMSLGGGTSSALDQAVQNAAAQGILFALAAGNESQHANTSSPGRANGSNIYTVSAFDSNGKLASFSNYGNPPVDFAAPGVGTYSTYKNGGYATMSGTSMAAPHVAGILLIRGGAPASFGVISGDKDSSPDPKAHI